MPQLDKIYIPTFISSVNYSPARVLPHVYFYNGIKYTNPYYVEYKANGTGTLNDRQLTQFPYFDNYSGNNPTSGSKSLLFFNEEATYGETPTGSLYSDYWETYVSLLYNPKTRLFNCSAIIPLADYFKMELNDIVEWRGNYYHLRAINNYNLANGECELELLGPVIGDTISSILPTPGCSFDYSVTRRDDKYYFYRVTMPGQGTARDGFYYEDWNNTPYTASALSIAVDYRFVARSGSIRTLISGTTITQGAQLTASVPPCTNNRIQSTGPGFSVWGYQDSSGSIIYGSKAGSQSINFTQCMVSGSYVNFYNPLTSNTIGANCTPAAGPPFNFTITITAKETQPGPYYGIYYSNDCNTYTYLQTSYLPNIGSSVNVEIPLGAICVRLVSTGLCNTSITETLPGRLQGDFSQLDFSSLDFDTTN